ncbi:diacylglycerol kinase family protein [uncultured Algibacter sp.]|uniref:diacylglycerol/lipid kinase family protein n=1 Tax=uncultured Algibacter sp. TaxID=298659 RepID=UPI0026385C40|nr:diacylglycerol kinase family protein [uncultured Algibacter sp.]
MNAASKSWFVIINPTSGNGSSKKSWPKIKQLLDKHHFIFEFAFTAYSKHSIALVHQAIKQHFKNIISVGGDGTLHNIVNGIMSQNDVPSSEINIGVIPIGTGNDWVKTHNIPKNFETAIQIIKNGRLATQDIGKLSIGDKNLPIFFNNLAGIGFDGLVVSRVEKYKHIGTLAYLYGTIISMFSFKNFESTVSVNSETISGKTLMILIGLCKYSGGGMQLTDKPNPFDGLLDVTIAQDLTKFEIIKNLAKLFNGTITNYKKVKTLKTKSVAIQINQEIAPYIQADGELIGKGHIKVSLIPNAFSFYC